MLALIENSRMFRRVTLQRSGNCRRRVGFDNGFQLKGNVTGLQRPVVALRNALG